MAEKILPALCERLVTTLSRITEDYEIILVCDGSPDASWQVMEGLARRYPELIAVKLSRNFGQHYAMTAGFDLSSGEWNVVMDCDLQDQPEEIPRLLERALEGYDIVLARRATRQHKWWKRKSSELFFRAFKVLSGFTLDSSVGSFRIMHRKVIDGYCQMRESYRMLAGMIEWLGFSSSQIDVDHAPRFEGESSYGLLRLIRMAADGMISFSNRPLYISVAIGFALSGTAGLYALYLILGALLSPAGPGVPGWLSTITATTFLGGLILLNQGVLGIYLGRLYNQAKGRPLYVIDRILRHGPGDRSGGGMNESGDRA